MTLPSIAPWAADVRISYGFEPSFFDRRQDDDTRRLLAPEAGATRPAPTNAPERPSGYDAPELEREFRRLNGQFLTSVDGARARKEWTDAFVTLLDFARTNRLRKAEEELLKLQTFRQDHRGSMVGGEIELYRPDYKPQLEALVRHLGNDGIRLEDRCDALERLEGLDLCAARHRSEIRREALRLQGLGGGLGEAVWSAFSELALGHLAALLRAEPRLAHLDFTTPHALNPFAAAVRLPGHARRSEQNDAYVVDVRIHADIVQRCAGALEQRLGMTTIAQHLADDCLLAVRGTLAREIGGAALDLCHGPGHWARLEKTVEQLAARFGDLHILDVIELDEDDQPRGLTADARLLTIRIRHNMARQQIAPAPMDQLLEERVVDGGPRRFRLFEGKWPYVVDDAPGMRKPAVLRLPTSAEIDDLIRPASGSQGLPARRFDDTARRVLTTFADGLRTTDAGPAVALRARVAADPSTEGLQTVIERQGLDDRTLAAWLDEAAPQWGAAALDDALQLLVGSRRATPLATLLSAWRAEGFADSWRRCVRDQAVRDRTLNADTRIQGQHEDGDLPGRGRPSPQQHLLARIEQQLGAVAPLADARACLQAFRERHPAGGDRRKAIGLALLEALGALRLLRAGPARLLTVPLLAEDGGFSEALESTFYAGSAARLQDELTLISKIATGLDLSPEETATLLQVTSRDRVPVPSPFASAALLSGRSFLVDELFDWATELFDLKRLDPSAAKRLLLPDAVEAGQAVSLVNEGPVFRALLRYLERLDTACARGVLTAADLAAAGSSSGASAALLRSAAERGGPRAVTLLEAWHSKFR
ncbi:hypothetical protein [Roseateles sp. L2-2]|uniref:hypothetical protein n=1 Tax=Roseateles TaxID=93681 RepID=UPI003D364293